MSSARRSSLPLSFRIEMAKNAFRQVLTRLKTLESMAVDEWLITRLESISLGFTSPAEREFIPMQRGNVEEILAGKLDFWWGRGGELMKVHFLGMDVVEARAEVTVHHTLTWMIFELEAIRKRRFESGYNASLRPVPIYPASNASTGISRVERPCRPALQSLPRYVIPPKFEHREEAGEPVSINVEQVDRPMIVLHPASPMSPSLSQHLVRTFSRSREVLKAFKGGRVTLGKTKMANEAKDGGGWSINGSTAPIVILS